MRAGVLAAALLFAPADTPSGGYWLSVEFAEGPGDGVDSEMHGAVTAAVATMTDAADGLDPPRDAIVGALVGHTGTVETALAWVARWAFSDAVGFADDPGSLREVPAPPPGGALRNEHGVHLSALLVSGATADGGSRTLGWPSDPNDVLPPELGWHAARLLPTSAPLYAAPSPTVPPAAERFAEARRSGGLYVLGYLDRCTAGDTQVCLRWAQVVARRRDRFTPGYLPAYQVAEVDGWVPDAVRTPRVQLAPSAIVGRQALFLLVARGDDGVVRRRTVSFPATDTGFPAVTTTVRAGRVTIATVGAPDVVLPVDPSIDARPR